MKSTAKRPRIQAVLSDPEAELALLPILRAIGNKAELCAASLQLGAHKGAIAAGIRPLLDAFGLPGPPPRVVLVHTDPGHPLPGWAASHASRERARGARILAIQRGVFHRSPPLAPVDPDVLLANKGRLPLDDGPDERPPWDAIAVWGRAFGEALPDGSLVLPYGSPVIDRLLTQIEGPIPADPDQRLRSLAQWRSQARALVRQELGLLAGRKPVLIALRPKGHWWPGDRLASLAQTLVETVFEGGFAPILQSDPRDGGEGARFVKGVALQCDRSPHVLTLTQWKALDRQTWLAGVAAIVSQGGEDGVLAAALGTPAIAVLPPDSPVWVDPLVIPGLYQVVKDPFAFVRSGLVQALAQTVGQGVDPAEFRAKAFVDEGGSAHRLAQAAYSGLARRSKKPVASPAQSL